MIAIEPTDRDWFTFLREGPIHREVNFWTPTPWRVSSLRDGDHFYFLLKAPVRKVGGMDASPLITNHSPIRDTQSM